MTERPYTDDDLRSEAARQYATLAEDPDFMGTGEQMQDAIVESTDDGTCARQTWHGLLVAPTPDDEYEAYGEAQKQIHDLINGAAEISEWAIHLGADGLEPLPEQLSAQTGNGAWFRLHFAVRPDMPDDMRRALVEGVGREIAKFF
ncbi:hypothetical protein [Streptomyces sp. BH105]|uniref:hypothetical protein n=1 Tax=Streptomyces sp. BH105 TaxID=3410408 RepID=UPI003CFA34DF